MAKRSWKGTAKELAKYYPKSFANSTWGYIIIRRNGKKICLGRWIWEELKGPIPKDYQINYINGINTDNRLSNLRCVPQKDVARNKPRRSDNCSGVQGVSIWKNKNNSYWRAIAHKPCGKQISRTFSVNKYGYEGAFQHACEKRREMELEYDYHENHGRG